MNTNTDPIIDRQTLISELKKLETHFNAHPEDRTAFLNNDNYVICTDENGYSYDDENIVLLPDGNRKTIIILVNKILALADTVLITDNGQLDYANSQWFKQHGFNILVTSRDSFGPLSSAIVCELFKISFG